MPKTPHGLQTASKFLTEHLERYIGKGFLTISNKPTWGSPKQYSVLLSTQYDPANSVVLAQIALRSEEINRFEFGTRSVDVTGVSFESEHLRRRIFVSLDGHQNIPNLTNPTRTEFLIRNDVRDFFSKGSKVYTEYERRWKVEAAANQIKVCKVRIKQQQALGPFVLD